MTTGVSRVHASETAAQTWKTTAASLYNLIARELNVPLLLAEGHPDTRIAQTLVLASAHRQHPSALDLRQTWRLLAQRSNTSRA